MYIKRTKNIPSLNALIEPKNSLLEVILQKERRLGVINSHI
jgi:hypothetical protein